MDWLDQFNWMDYGLLAISAIFVLGGYTKGFTRQVLQLAGLVVGFYAALVYTPQLSELNLLDRLREYNAEACRVVTFVGIFLATVVVWNIAVELVGRWLRGRRLLRTVDGLLGGALGGIKAVLVVGGICLGLLTWGNLRDFGPFRDSVLAPRMAAGCSALVLLIPEATREHMHDFNEMVHDELRTRKLLNPGVTPSLATSTPSIRRVPDPDVDGANERPSSVRATVDPSRRPSSPEVRPRRLPVTNQSRTNQTGTNKSSPTKTSQSESEATRPFDPTQTPRPPSQRTGRRISEQPLGTPLGRHLGQKALSGNGSRP